MLASSNGCYFLSARSSNHAPPLGFEPRTSKLTVSRSKPTELRRNFVGRDGFEPPYP